MKPLSKSQQRRFAVRKDPNKRARVTLTHQNKKGYRRPKSDVNRYLEELNENWQGDMSDE